MTELEPVTLSREDALLTLRPRSVRSADEPVPLHATYHEVDGIEREVDQLRLAGVL